MVRSQGRATVSPAAVQAAVPSGGVWHGGCAVTRSCHGCARIACAELHAEADRQPMRAAGAAIRCWCICWCWAAVVTVYLHRHGRFDGDIACVCTECIFVSFAKLAQW